MRKDIDFVTGRKDLPHKSQSKTSLFLVSLVKKVKQAIYDECLSGNRIILNEKCASGTIEIYMTSQGDCEVLVLHADNEHRSPTLEATIVEMMPDWWSIQSKAEDEEREEQEFRDYLWRNSRYW